MMPDQAKLPDPLGPDLSPPPVFFRFMLEVDVPQIVKLGEEFFAESDMPEVGEFSAENFEKHLRHVLKDPHHYIIVLEDAMMIVGFIEYAVGAPYTKDPLCFGSLLYVVPEFRRSPAGRLLVQAAESEARAMGCTAMYMGAMAGIPGVSRSLPNMFRKMGFDPMPFWGRKKIDG